MHENEIAVSLAVGALILLLYFAYSIFFKSQSHKKSASKLDDEYFNESKESQQVEDEDKVDSRNRKTKKQISAKQSDNHNRDSGAFKHPWLASILKSHSDKCTGIDFSPNGKYLISAGNDRAIFLWSTKEFDLKQHKSIRCNVEFDHATKVRFSPDSRSFIALLGNSNTIRAFKIAKKEDSTVHVCAAAMDDFPNKHQTEIINIGISCNAKFLMTCSRDTLINIWSPKGHVLETIDTKLMKNTYACVSTCGRFFAVCGFTPEVKVWQVVFDKTESFKEVRRAFELKSHKAGIHHFAFNTDSTRMVTVSKDQTWIVWDTNIDYQRGQEAKIMLHGNIETKGPSFVALSPDLYCLAIVTGNELHFINALSGKTDQIVENICQESINEMSFSIDNKYLAVACERHIKIFHNLSSSRVALEDLSEKLKTARTQAARERIEQSIEEHKKYLKLHEE